MIQIAINLLIAASMLLTNIQAHPEASPEVRQRAENVAMIAISVAKQALAPKVSSTDTPVTLQEPQGGDFGCNCLPSSISSLNTASETVLEPLAFTVSPVVTFVGTTTGSNIWPDDVYKIHYETNKPVTGVFKIQSNSIQTNDTASTTVDFVWTNIWGIQYPFTITATDSESAITAGGIIKG